MQRIPLPTTPLHLELSFLNHDDWTALSPAASDDGSPGQWCFKHASGLNACFELHPAASAGAWDYRLEFSAPFPTRMRLKLVAEDTAEVFHLIPANIHGDNNLAHGEPGHFPNLTAQRSDSAFSSPLWEFRADRTPYPVSALCLHGAVAAISIDPYSDADDQPDGYIANGLLAELPAACGVALGYGNDPVTFINKEAFGPASCHRTTRASVGGRIYHRAGDRRAVHGILREEYDLRAETPEAARAPGDAARALCDAFVGTNYSAELGAYTNMCIFPEAGRPFRAWRPLLEIGWTGGSPLAYPLLRAERQLDLPADYFAQAASGHLLFDRIAAARNPKSGFLYDLTQPWIVGDPPGNHVNGWWTGYPLCRDVHGAYTNGSAVYYLFKALLELQARGAPMPGDWVRAATGTIENAIRLQRADGNFGFAYALDEARVTDWEGFAGCWFAAAAALGWQLTADHTYLESAKKALGYYGGFVRDLNCWGTPMDTWKSVDEEGNLAFIKAARHVHEATGEAAFLADAIDGANYELLWRYGYRTRPIAPPLNNGRWNACGGSITSVSNPHAHPMGLIVTGDLLWLAEATGDAYWKERAGDGVRWIMQCMELYPEQAGYGRYGVLTERFCPSDGLLCERYQDGTASSMWFSYNGWAAAAALEGVLDWMDAEEAYTPPES